MAEVVQLAALEGRMMSVPLPQFWWEVIIQGINLCVNEVR
jgi:hypothetical protein